MMLRDLAVAFFMTKLPFIVQPAMAMRRACRVDKYNVFERLRRPRSIMEVVLDLFLGEQ